VYARNMKYRSYIYKQGGEATQLARVSSCAL
jgi:hypothetical protein